MEEYLCQNCLDFREYREDYMYKPIKNHPQCNRCTIMNQFFIAVLIATWMIVVDQYLVGNNVYLATFTSLFSIVGFLSVPLLYNDPVEIE